MRSSQLPNCTSVPLPAASSSSRAGKVWLIVLVVVGLVVAGFVALAIFGFNMIAEDVKRELRDNPVVRAGVGEINEIDLNLTASVSIDDGDVWVFDVKGTKSDGELTVATRTRDDGSEEVLSGSLRLPDGTTHDLFPEGPQ